MESIKFAERISNLFKAYNKSGGSFTYGHFTDELNKIIKEYTKVSNELLKTPDIEELFGKFTYANYAGKDGKIIFDKLEEPVYTITKESFAQAVVEMLKIAEANKIALTIAESITPKLTEQEQAFFIAGFVECAKLNSNFTE